MLDMLDKPNMLHAIVVHMPIALAMLGVPIVFLGVVMSVDRPVFRRLAVAAYLILAVSAAVASQTGEMARDLVPPTIDTTASNLLETHERMAEVVWIFSLITAVLLGLSLINIKSLRIPWVYRTTVGLAMVFSLFTAGWVAFIGHYGGTLVYEHGIGTRFAQQHYAPVPTPPIEGAELGGEAPEGPAETAAVDDWPEEEDPELELLPIRPIDMALAQEVSFINDIKPIIDAKCLECHEGFDAEGEYWMESVEMMLEEGKKAGPGIIPGQPDESSVIKYIRGEFKPRMPKGEPPLTEDELHLFRMWIAAGAIDDTSGAPEVEVTIEGEGAPGETEAEPMVDLTEPAEPEAEVAPAPEPEPMPAAPTQEAPAAEAPAPEADQTPLPEEKAAEPAPEALAPSEEPAPAAPAPDEAPAMEEETADEPAEAPLPAAEEPEAAPAPATDSTEAQPEAPAADAPAEQPAPPAEAPQQNDPPPDVAPDTDAAPGPEADATGPLSISVEEVPQPTSRTERAEGEEVIKKEQGAIREPKPEAEPVAPKNAPETAPSAPEKSPRKEAPVPTNKKFFRTGDKIA